MFEIIKWYNEYGLEFDLDFFYKHKEVFTEIYFEFHLENSNRFGLYLFLKKADLLRFLVRDNQDTIPLDAEYGKWVKFANNAEEIRNYIKKYIG